MTPAAAVALQGSLTLICIIQGNIFELIDFASFLTWVFYGLAMIALLIMRRTKAYVHRPYRVPTIVPWLVLGIAIFLAVAPIIDNPSKKYLFTLLFILAGVAIYHFYVYENRQSDFSSKIRNDYFISKYLNNTMFYDLGNLTRLIQKLFMVVPPDEELQSEESSEDDCIKNEIEIAN